MTDKDSQIAEAKNLREALLWTGHVLRNQQIPGEAVACQTHLHALAVNQAGLESAHATLKDLGVTIDDSQEETPAEAEG